MSYVVALHGGDSKTTAVAISPDCKILAKSSGRPCDPSVTGFGEVAKTIYFALTDLVLSARLSLSSYTWMSIAVEGLSKPEDGAALLSHLSGILGPTSRISVHSAQEAAYYGVFREGAGVLVSVGIGSSAYAVKNGVEVKAGGWGPIIDDEGGGYWMGAKAIGAALQSHDGRMPGTVLTQMILRWLSLQRPDEIAGWYRGATSKDVASLATLVLGAAKSGDKVATGILRECARELAKMVWAVWERTDVRVPVEVAFTGELFREDPYVAQLVMEELKSLGLEATAKVDVYSSLLGAALLALKSSGIEVRGDSVESLRSSIESIL